MCIIQYSSRVSTFSQCITSTPIPTYTALTYHSKRDKVTQGPRAVTQQNLGGDCNKYSPKRKPLSRVVARSNSYSYILE
jgi:hypothetical protein